METEKTEASLTCNEFVKEDFVFELYVRRGIRFINRLFSSHCQITLHMRKQTQWLHAFMSIKYCCLKGFPNKIGIVFFNNLKDIL